MGTIVAFNECVAQVMAAHSQRLLEIMPTFENSFTPRDIVRRNKEREGVNCE
jgi:hypothetical protein